MNDHNEIRSRTRNIRGTSSIWRGPAGPTTQRQQCAAYGMLHPTSVCQLLACCITRSTEACKKGELKTMQISWQPAAYTIIQTHARPAGG
jgi:hypothetical protein